MLAELFSFLQRNETTSARYELFDDQQHAKELDVVDLLRKLLIHNSVNPVVGFRNLILIQHRAILRH